VNKNMSLDSDYVQLNVHCTTCDQEFLTRDYYDRKRYTPESIKSENYWFCPDVMCQDARYMLIEGKFCNAEGEFYRPPDEFIINTIRKEKGLHEIPIKLILLRH
jgi:hypothetical protein